MRRKYEWKGDIKRRYKREIRKRHIEERYGKEIRKRKDKNGKHKRETQIELGKKEYNKKERIKRKRIG